ncbi:hypothetical protein, partial [Ralstonia solanacearum species complex bacterium KE055]|uniref:hypothetical protein n=1 Tax=Ralstonia solanacearum species complex bacterium KE055 TaxID=3119586 RepID=UPI002FC33939
TPAASAVGSPNITLSEAFANGLRPLTPLARCPRILLPSKQRWSGVETRHLQADGRFRGFFFVRIAFARPFYGGPGGASFGWAGCL